MSISIALSTLYILIVCLLVIYLHRVIFLSIHEKLHKWEDSLAATTTVNLPIVTVQLPVYNESTVINRLLDSVCALDYPSDRLQIQVLDDSTDITTELILLKVDFWRQRGIPIEHVRRTDRRGHKAGNLANALPLARGEFIAIFDADFIPDPAWLRNAIRYFLSPGSERLGLVQTRRNHINTDDSLLTYAQSMAFDQFSIAQTTRIRFGLWSSFYGSAGLWRKVCIEDAGGWSSNTFSEDLDIAYQAQLRGWKIGYDNAILAAAEVPPSMLAYKQQQLFWSRGNMQVSRLLWKRLLTVKIPLFQRLDALLFSTWPVTHLLLLARILIQLLSLIWPAPWMKALDFAVIAALSVGLIPSIIDVLHGRVQTPFHLSLGIGISVNNTVGLLMGLFGPIGIDSRAPTPRSADKNAVPAIRRNTTRDLITLAELLLSLGGVIGCIAAFQQGRWWLILMLSNDIPGYVWVGAQSAWETLKLYFPRVMETQK